MIVGRRGTTARRTTTGFATLDLEAGRPIAPPELLGAVVVDYRDP